eukprot:COSAG01_NODE_2459_length_7655_cov_138.985442_4_plen_86_part_00
MSAPRCARPRGKATKRAYCRRRRAPAAPDTRRYSSVEHGTDRRHSKQRCTDPTERFFTSLLSESGRSWLEVWIVDRSNVLRRRPA